MGIFGKSYKTESDEQLMQLSALSDQLAFSELYDRYATRMVNYFYRMLGNDRDKAEDFMQDLFTKLIHKPELYKVGRPFKPWIYSIANNMCKNEYRRLSIRNNSPMEVHENTKAFQDLPSHSRKMDLKTFNEQLSKQLDGLDQKHRTAFILRYKEEFSIREISEIMECSEGTVKSRLFYTLKKLSSNLAVYDPRQKENSYE